MKNDIKIQIAKNSESMSDLYLIEALENAATSSGTMINGDLGLERMLEVIRVVAKHNYFEKLNELQLKINSLNQFRSMYSYKPNGFDLLVDDLGGIFFFAMIDSGLGLSQLKTISYLFPLNILKMFQLEYLRGSK